MRKGTRYLGLDVHAATIAVAIAEGRGEVRSLGTIPNRPEAVQKLLNRLGDVRTLHACYEAGPTGHVLHWQLTKLGVQCEVIAPSLVSVKSGDRIKTERRDAEKLARALRAGDLTAVFVPDAEHEGLRDLVRTREATKTDELHARHRVSKLLLRYGKYPPAGSRAWSLTWWRWLRTVTFEHAAQCAAVLDYVSELEHQMQSMRGVAKTTAVTLAVEVGSFRRFERATQLMS
jgi:transposase